jgi:hypothetical protein
MRKRKATKRVIVEMKGKEAARVQGKEATKEQPSTIDFY